MNSLTIIPTPVTDTPTGGRVIDIGKGSHLVLTGHQGNSPYDVFMMALMGSISRGGKPVRCTNFVRGVSLLLDSTMPPVSGEEAESLFDFIYASVEPALKAWLGRGPGVEPLCHERSRVRDRVPTAGFLRARCCFLVDMNWSWFVGSRGLELPASVGNFRPRYYIQADAGGRLLRRAFVQTVGDLDVAPSRWQYAMDSLLDYVGTIHHHNRICISYRRKTVRDDNRGLPYHQFLQWAANLLLAKGIEM